MIFTYQQNEISFRTSVYGGVSFYLTAKISTRERRSKNRPFNNEKKYSIVGVRRLIRIIDK